MWLENTGRMCGQLLSACSSPRTAPKIRCMTTKTPFSSLRTTLFTLATGAVGAGLGYWLSFPVFVLTGPALVVGTLCLFGLRFAIAPPLWNAALLTIGLSVGSRVSADATAALLRWPLAFLAFAAMLAAIMLVSRHLLSRYFGLGRRASVLASTPGHLSLILSLAAEMKADVLRISTVQAVRIMALTLAVPFMAKAFGMEMGAVLAAPGVAMTPAAMAVLAGCGLLLGLALRRLHVPAPMLIGGLAVSTLAHMAGWANGPFSPWVSLPGFIVVGTMIGSRFSGTSLARLRRDGLAGLAMTGVAMGLAMLAAWPIAPFLGMPYLHVLVAFAPGGLETMVAMGAVLGANPGFVVACHVARLFLLLLLLPLMLPRRAAPEASP